MGFTIGKYGVATMVVAQWEKSLGRTKQNRALSGEITEEEIAKSAETMYL